MSGAASTNKHKHKHKHKRRHVASGESEDVADPCVAVCASMRPFVGGRGCCNLSELTLAIFRGHALSAGMLAPCEMVQVRVGDVSGKTTVVDMAKGVSTSSVDALKGRLAEVVGIPRERQYLIDPDGKLLGDTHVIGTSCALVLVVDEVQYSWDPESSLFASRCPSQSESRMDVSVFASHPRYDLISDGRQVVRTTGCIDHHLNSDHALLTVPAMTPDAGDVHTVSFRVTSPLSRSVPPNVFGYDFDDLRVSCGLVRAGHSDNRCIHGEGWRISTDTGGLRGSGVPNQSVYSCVPEGEIPFGAVLRMTLDIANGTLRFAVDGVPRETGFVDIPTDAALQWAVTAPMPGTIIEIVPN
jgi:hypothetical protein